MERINVVQVLGTLVAGAIGYFTGLYGTVFLVVTIWGFGVESFLFIIITIGTASVVAGIAMALTVRKSRRMQAVMTSVIMGAVLAGFVVVIRGGTGEIYMGGLLLVTVTGFLVRSGAVDGIVGVRDLNS